MERYESAARLLDQRRPERPVLCLRPHAAARAARWFRDAFPGTVIYALKANDAPEIARALLGAGIRHFDVASRREMEQLSGLPDAVLHLMHPVKARETIREAYFRFGVRTFALDTASELEKMREATDDARDLHLVVRLECSNADSLIPLEGKFGASEDDAPALLLGARQAARRLGVTFHVGSQAMVPARFSEALGEAGRVVANAGVLIDHIDVGGGFPSRYPNIEPPDLAVYMSEIRRGLAGLAVSPDIEVTCEPGRALVAEAESVLVRVEARRGHSLYINDGAFGTLYDAAHSGFSYPARLVDTDGGREAALEPFTLFGPSCDSADMMPGPYMLPGSVREGDYIEIGQVGAYGRVLATRFNGFGDYDEVVLLDPPMLTMYPDQAAPVVEADNARPLGR